MGAENEHLKGQVLDLQLDLTDAVKSRRELQQQLQEAETKIDSMAQAYDILKVRFEAPPSETTELVIEKLQKQNPYIAVLIDGDGLLVGTPCFPNLIPCPDSPLPCAVQRALDQTRNRGREEGSECPESRPAQRVWLPCRRH